MASAHDLLWRTLQPDDAPGPHWDRVVAALHEISRPQATAGGQAALHPESERVLRAFLEHEGGLVLSPDTSVPHSMPPHEMVRAHAVQVLARADLAKHRALIQHVADHPQSSDRLASIARAALRPE
ncbi:MAG: hypothetical protein OEY20_07750 [Gemmatimonadota bacterium]|nr:hypothetical protein [Gemmatimonadota bacterium]MDH4352212.1 hypothetical protein [Gemmatimonadota bacterium]MDH5197127.1 hypothetical protein [Gemmatimonadota bacterium]